MDDIINALHMFFRDSLPEYKVKIGLTSGPWKCQDTEYIPYGENVDIAFLLLYDISKDQGFKSIPHNPCYRIHIGGSKLFLSLIEHHDSTTHKKITLLTSVPLEDPKCFDILLKNICQEESPPKITSTPSPHASKKNASHSTSNTSHLITSPLSTQGLS